MFHQHLLRLQMLEHVQQATDHSNRALSAATSSWPDRLHREHARWAMDMDNDAAFKPAADHASSLTTGGIIIGTSDQDLRNLYCNLQAIVCRKSARSVATSSWHERLRHESALSQTPAQLDYATTRLAVWPACAHTFLEITTGS